MREERAAPIIESLDSLIQSNHVIDYKENSPEKVFQLDAMKTPSLHLRIGYGTDGRGPNKRWHSYYPIDSLPSNVRALVDGCKSLSNEAIASLPSEKMPAGTARLMVNNNVAKIKIAHNGDVYLNKNKVSLEELKSELTRLKQVEGIVWYHREDAHEAPSGKAEAVIDDVLKLIIELKLPVKMSEKDFQ